MRKNPQSMEILNYLSRLSCRAFTSSLQEVATKRISYISGKTKEERYGIEKIRSTGEGMKHFLYIFLVMRLTEMTGIVMGECSDRKDSEC